MKIFYDGLNIEKYASNPKIEGFTTNCSFFSEYNIRNYKEYYEKYKHTLNGRSISFQVWQNGDDGIQQINELYDLIQSDPLSNIYVKIPIIDTDGKYNDYMIQYAISKNIHLNITVIYTEEQIQKTYDLLKDYTQPVILSIFAGPISDSGIDPNPYVQKLQTLFQDKSNVEILWAGCRELYTIIRAKQLNCDIITVPGDILDKMNLFESNPLELSLARVKKFQQDAIKGELKIER